MDNDETVNNSDRMQPYDGGKIMKEKDLLLVQIEEDICTLVINRPEKRNVVNPEILSRIGETLREISEDGQIRVVVLRGAGEQAFSAGYDIPRLYKSEDFSIDDPVEEAMSSIESCAVPVIAMIYGYCIGASCGLAIACDLRLAADNARMGITVAKLGVVYPPSATMRLINIVGVSAAKELLYTGRLVDAEKAGEIRMVDQVVPSEDLFAVTYDLARKIADNSPQSVRSTKRIISKLLAGQALSPQAREEFLLIRKQIVDSDDFKEGQKAFAEKRQPRFRGK